MRKVYPSSRGLNQLCYNCTMQKFVMGVDEAGRAPLAGPVSVGFILVPEHFDVLKEFPEALRFHHLKARTAGADTFIKFNVHFNPDLSLREVHEVCDKMEIKIKAKIPRSEVYIHAEPEDVSHVDTEQDEDIT